MRVLFACLTLVALSACEFARGDVIVANGTAEPVRFAVAYGDGAIQRLPPLDSTATTRLLAPGAEVRLGPALALADSGGVTVAFYAASDSSDSRPEMLSVEAAGAGYLRDAFGDTVLRIA